MESEEKYSESLSIKLQAGIWLIFAVWVIASLLLARRYPLTVMPVFICGFFGLPIGIALTNLIPSSFQRRSHLVASRIGREISLFWATPFPMARLLVYKEGVEFRRFPRRYFVPYTNMERPKISGIFSNHLMIYPDLPGVPFMLEFSCPRIKVLAEIVDKAYGNRRKGHRSKDS